MAACAPLPALEGTVPAHLETQDFPTLLPYEQTRLTPLDPQAAETAAARLEGRARGLQSEAREVRSARAADAEARRLQARARDLRARAERLRATNPDGTPNS